MVVSLSFLANKYKGFQRAVLFTGVSTRNAPFWVFSTDLTRKILFYNPRSDALYRASALREELIARFGNPVTAPWIC